jgi:hypothetical protein
VLPQCKNSPKKKEREMMVPTTWVIHLMSFGDVEDKSNNGDVPCKARPQMCLLAMFLKGSLKVVIVV